MTAESIFRKGKLPDENETLMGNIVKGLTSTSPLGRKNLHGSDASYCARRNSMMLNMPSGLEGEMGASSAFYFSIGSAVHETIQKALKNTGMLIAAEFRMANLGIAIGGYVDVIARIDDRPRIVEIKTCGQPPSKPKPEHVAQAITYSLVTGIPDPIILYASRNVAAWDGKLIMKQFELESTRDVLFINALGIYRSLHYGAAKRLADIPTYIMSKKDCGFCPFIKECWDGGGDFPVVKPSPEEKDELETKARADAIALTKRALGWPNEAVRETARLLKEHRDIDLIL